MTDAQVLTMAIALILPLSMLLYSNSRITDTKDTLRAEMAAGFARMSDEMRGLNAAMRADVAALRADIAAQAQSFEAKLKIHELEHHHR